VLDDCAQCRADYEQLADAARVLDTAVREEKAALAESSQPAATARTRPEPAATGPSASIEQASVATPMPPSVAAPFAPSERGTARTDASAAPFAPRAPGATKDPLARRRWTLPIAVAAGLAFAFVVWSVLTDARKSDHVLGAYAVECRAPVGKVEQYTEFRARGAKPAHGWFRFEIFDESAAPGSPPVLAADHRPEITWHPKQEELAQLPDRIRWRAAAVDANGNEVDEDTATAWRGP
jgi:hypothetical protein